AALSARDEPGMPRWHDRERGPAVERGDDRKLLSDPKLLDRDLHAMDLQAVRSAGEPGPGTLGCPATARLKQRDTNSLLAGQDARQPGRQGSGVRRQREADRGAA